jgi:aryl-alcohol dehydrogenase-like predicted oxidoreductase
MTRDPSWLDSIELGVGAWAWGDTLVWGYGRDHNDGDVRAAFDASLAANLHFFDTAEMYGRGQSERLLGQFIRISQQPILIATKFMPLPWRWRRSSLIAALRRSLKRLGIPQVDLYQLHWPAPPRSVETWAEALADAVEAGLTREVGVSNYSVEQMQRAFDVLNRRGIHLASNQVEYNLLRRDIEHNGLMDLCRQLDVRVIAYSPLGMGLLTGKYTPENPLPGVRRWNYYGQQLPKIQPLLNRLHEVGTAHGGKTPAQVALNWTICKGTLPIPGAKNARQAEQNAGALGWRLTAEEVATLDAASQQVLS